MSIVTEYLYHMDATGTKIVAGTVLEYDDVNPEPNYDKTFYTVKSTDANVWANSSLATYDTTTQTFTVATPNPALELAAVQQSKITDLEAKCNESILNGFDYTINSISYHFFLPITAQANFTGTQAQFKDAKITSVRWTVLNNTTGKFERIDIDAATFDILANQVFSYVDTNIRKLRDTLEPQVYAITPTAPDAIAQVQAIVW